MTANPMNSIVREMVDFVAEDGSVHGVIPWSCPIPAFGNFCEAKVATLGINPSNREFTDSCLEELSGSEKRFPTLKSLNLRNWKDVKNQHITEIVEACRTYFFGPSYDVWFRKLDVLFAEAGYSYYPIGSPACHLDLVPWATFDKWTGLKHRSKRRLLEEGAKFLGKVINETEVRILILNGTSVFKNLNEISKIEVDKEFRPEWSLPRNRIDDVIGVSYEGYIRSVGGIDLKDEVYLLGYNHNLQSSFGVTRGVHSSIADWISHKVNSKFYRDGERFEKSVAV